MNRTLTLNETKNQRLTEKKKLEYVIRLRLDFWRGKGRFYTVLNSPRLDLSFKMYE